MSRSARDVLVLDEASQVLYRRPVTGSWQILATQTGARIKLVGDTEQLGPVEAGGIFRLLARRQGNWKLQEVRRFAESWEGPASLRLRDGDLLALGEYRPARPDLPRPARPDARGERSGYGCRTTCAVRSPC